MSAIAQSTFMGASLANKAQVTKATPARNVQVQALFKKKAAPVRSATKKVSSQGAGRKAWLGGEQDYTLDKWYGPDRKLYLPSGLLDPSDVPDYLTGELAGDYGYDPLGLSKTPEDVEKYREFEILHARWAMLGAAGAIIPEGLAANGAEIKGATWFETGAAMLNGGTLNYFAVPWKLFSNPLPLVVVIAIEVALMGAVEKYRRDGTGPAGYAPGVGKFDSDVFTGLDPVSPGGPFDPLGLADDPEVFAELKVKEIKNGRLAMVSMLGFFIQAAVTGEGPFANWQGHVADPFGYNLLTIIGEERAATL